MRQPRPWRPPQDDGADDDVDADATGLTQDVDVMDIDRASAGPPRGLGAADGTTAGWRVRPHRGSGASWNLLRCTMCQDADPYHAADSRGLMQHLVRAHLGQPLLAETVAQLRGLGREACRICSSIRARTNPRCTTCGCATATRPLQLGDVIPDRRRGAPAAPSNAATQPSGADAAAPPPAGASQSLTTDDEWSQVSPSYRDVVVSEPTRRDLERLSQRPLDDLPICVASRMATCFAESLEGCVAGHEAWGVLARYRTRLLLAPVPEGADRNEELKRRLRL